MRPIEQTIAENLCEHPAEIIEQLREVRTTRVELPPGERAIYAMSRDESPPLPYIQERQLLLGKKAVDTRSPTSLVMRTKTLYEQHPTASVHIFPQALVVHEAVVKYLEAEAEGYMKECPQESTWVQNHLDAACAIGRYDVEIHPDGTIGICEIDLEASLWGDADEYNQIVETHILGFLDRRLADGYQVVSTELPETTDYYYQHNDTGVDGTHIPFVPLSDLSDKHLVIPRGRRNSRFKDTRENTTQEISFEEYMQEVESKSLIPGKLRDCKIALAARKLGVLATKEDAFTAIKELFDEDELNTIAIKGLFSARTSDTLIAHNKGRRRPGLFKPEPMKKRLEGYDDPYGGLVIMQPAYQHATAKDLGLEFTDSDRGKLLGYPHVQAEDIRRFMPGQEEDHKVTCRIFVLFDKTLNKRPRVIGGLAAGLPGEIVHNHNKAAVWPIYCEGVKTYPNIRPYYHIPTDPSEYFNRLEQKISEQALKLLHVR